MLNICTSLVVVLTLSIQCSGEHSEQWTGTVHRSVFSFVWNMFFSLFFFISFHTPHMFYESNRNSIQRKINSRINKMREEKNTIKTKNSHVQSIFFLFFTSYIQREKYGFCLLCLMCLFKILALKSFCIFNVKTNCSCFINSRSLTWIPIFHLECEVFVVIRFWSKSYTWIIIIILSMVRYFGFWRRRTCEEAHKQMYTIYNRPLQHTCQFVCRMFLLFYVFYTFYRLFSLNSMSYIDI